MSETAELEILEGEECWRLLAEHDVKVGRIAFLKGGYPVVLPVNYRVDHGTIVFRTGIGSKLDSVAVGSPVAFQVDAVDPSWQEGWSVLAQGRAEEVVAPGELAPLRRLGLHPWGPGERSRYVRVHAEHVTGRRIR